MISQLKRFAERTEGPKIFIYTVLILYSASIIYMLVSYHNAERAFDPVGSIEREEIFSSFLDGLPGWLAAGIVILICCGSGPFILGLSLISWRSCPFTKKLLFGMAAYVGIFLIFIISANIIQPFFERKKNRALEQATGNAKPLIVALHLHYDQEGFYPANLGELVPQYIHEIPNTGMAGYPQYEYLLDDRHSDHYVLKINLSPPWTLSEEMWFWPEQDYDRESKSGPWRYQQEFHGWIRVYY